VYITSDRNFEISSQVTMNSEARLNLELNEAQTEIQRLRDLLATAPPTVHKDLSLISLVPKWSGSESAISLEEFFSSIEGSARIGHQAEADCLQVAILKLVDSARTFYYSCPELHRETVSWQSFKAILHDRFKDVRTDQFHYIQLQTARQRRNKGPQEFADRCRALAQKLVCRRPAGPARSPRECKAHALGGFCFGAEWCPR
jgi:hypothetical protein